MTLEPDYGLAEIAKAIGMSTRWVRDRVNIDGATHIRYGNKIRMTEAMVEELRQSHVKAAPVPQSITTGRRKKAS